MRPAAFWYHRPETAAEVDQLITELSGQVYLLAGGQSLIPAMNNRTIAPDHVIDLNYLRDEPRQPVVTGRQVSIGPLVRLSALERPGSLTAAIPVLPELLAVVASSAVRSRATVLGNIMAADPAAELPALAMLLSASLTLRGPAGVVSIPLGQAIARRYERDAGGPAERRWAIGLTLTLPAAGTRFGFAETARHYAGRAIAGAVAAASPEKAARRVGMVIFGTSGQPLQLDLSCPAQPGKQFIADIGAAVSNEVAVADDVQAPAAYRRFAAASMASACAAQAVGTRYVP